MAVSRWPSSQCVCHTQIQKLWNRFPKIQESRMRIGEEDESEQEDSGR